MRRAVIGKSPSILRHWVDADTELALWQREFEPSVTSELDRLSQDQLPQARFITSPDLISSAIEKALHGWASEHNDLFPALAGDIEALVARFFQMTGSDAVKLRLEAIRDDACRLFHIDRARARLTTTYVGPGTEWVPCTHAADALASQENYEGPLHQMPRFAVGIFPGALSPFGGLLHRSPHIAGSGEHRLLLCLTQSG